MSSSDSPSSGRSGARSALPGLVALNVALLLVLAVVVFAPSADAQNRGRGDYTMVGGKANGAESSAVYIVDAANQEMIVVTFNINSRTLEGLGYRNLAADAATVLRRRPGN